MKMQMKWLGYYGNWTEWRKMEGNCGIVTIFLEIDIPKFDKSNARFALFSGICRFRGKTKYAEWQIEEKLFRLFIFFCSFVSLFLVFIWDLCLFLSSFTLLMIFSYLLRVIELSTKRNSPLPNQKTYSPYYSACATNVIWTATYYDKFRLGPRLVRLVLLSCGQRSPKLITARNEPNIGDIFFSCQAYCLPGIYPNIWRDLDAYWSSGSHNKFHPTPPPQCKHYGSEHNYQRINWHARHIHRQLQQSCCCRRHHFRRWGGKK